MQEAQYDFLHGQTDRSDFFSPAMQQLCGIMKDNQVALPSDIGEGYFRYISPVSYTHLTLPTILRV